MTLNIMVTRFNYEYAKEHVYKGSKTQINIELFGTHLTDFRLEVLDFNSKDFEGYPIKGRCVYPKEKYRPRKYGQIAYFDKKGWGKQDCPVSKDYNLFLVGVPEEDFIIKTVYTKPAW